MTSVVSTRHAMPARARSTFMRTFYVTMSGHSIKASMVPQVYSGWEMHLNEGLYRRELDRIVSSQS